MVTRRRSPSATTSGMPIEEAPFWVLAIITPIFGLVLFLGAVGLQNAIGLWRGQWQATAIAALLAAALLVAALARLAPWRRPRPGEPDTRPRRVRVASWLLATAASGFVLEGVLTLLVGHGQRGPLGVAFLMALLAGVRLLLGWTRR